MKRVLRHGAGIAGWSIRHPIGVVMLTLAVVVLGVFALKLLQIDLLPRIIYPEVRVRIIDPGVPATVMEDEITRQLEEQLAITEDAIHIQSQTREGRSAVDLAFAYGKDIDVALRDASTRLDRAKRFLPDTIDPPVIYKRDPSQLPVADYIVTSPLRDPVALRDWVDYTLSKYLLNLPGVAAVEVGGGLLREVQVVADQDRLAAMGIDILSLADTIADANQDLASGRLIMPRREVAGRTAGRFTDLRELVDLPLQVRDASGRVTTVRLGDATQIVDGHEDERLKVRLNGIPGIKVSIQKQPQANTVSVVAAVQAELDKLTQQGLLPEDIKIRRVNDEARYIERALNNAGMAALGGGVLAMLVVYVFLGSLRRTLIIGSAIPIAILVTFILMAAFDLTLNVMTLGGLALGIGMLVDSTIVMLENIYRHQREGEHAVEASTHAAAEVNSAIVASTSTNLAAVLPFLFIGGLIGLLFQELIFTISSAIVASMVVALTLIPALAGRISSSREGLLRRGVNAGMSALQRGYAWLLSGVLKLRWLVIAGFAVGMWAALTFAVNPFQGYKDFLPRMDDGRIRVMLTAEHGISVTEMDRVTARIESLVMAQPEVDTVFTIVGGFVFGRSQYEASNRSNIEVQLHAERGGVSSKDWIGRLKRLIGKEGLVGIKVRIRERGIRGLRVSRGDDDVSLRIKGRDLATLERLGKQVAATLEDVPGLSNVRYSGEDVNQELSIKVDRERAAAYGLSVADVGRAVRFALGGRTITDFITNDRSIDVVLRLDRNDIATPADLQRVLLFSRNDPRSAVRLGSIADIRLVATPAEILRDRQQRIVEITASLSGDLSLRDALNNALKAAAKVELPTGYAIYEAGNLQALQEGESAAYYLLGLAVFLVLVVMAVQYESLRNPVIILLSVPFAAIGVALGLMWTETPISVPVWLGLIMLAGIVVNNAIVLVEYIEIQRDRTEDRIAAIIEAARLRLRPILMTTLTTVVGMLPLAYGLGQGAEMLQPLAITLVSGLLFSTLVSLVLVPCMYLYLGRSDAPASERRPSELASQI